MVWWWFWVSWSACWSMGFVCWQVVVKLVRWWQDVDFCHGLASEVGLWICRQLVIGDAGEVTVCFWFFSAELAKLQCLAPLCAGSHGVVFGYLQSVWFVPRNLLCDQVCIWSVCETHLSAVGFRQFWQSLKVAGSCFQWCVCVW